MHRLASILFLIGLSAALFSQNPHGEEIRMDCAACHSPAGWEISQEYWKGIELVKPAKSKTTGLPMPLDTTKFHHNKTDFPLTGQHKMADCRSCHESLVFVQAQTECISCHTDMHQMTVGSDCARCHDTNNWLVDNITELHQENGFPLIGAHASVNCFDCHTSETALRFDRIGNDCINCHLDDFRATTNPDHEDAGFSTNCIECHDVNNFDWETEKVDHSFFPLTKGHEVNECAKCHVGGDFANTPTDCFACHQVDFEATANPDHELANFITDCAACHTTDIGWMPAEYLAHDTEHFPIYSGAHKGTWDDCASCHTDASDYAVFSCVVCHANPETDDVHNNVSGYAYENSACLACHPMGTADGSFDHDATNFPLTGAHIGVDCISCHVGGYTGTPTDCAACHTADFQNTTNPDHENLTFSTDCASCHTTEPDWIPATFANHNDYYQLNGAHAAIANDCAACHNGDYNNTPSTCVGCHQTDFDNTTDPDHVAAQFPTDCTQCHSENEWTSSFDHNTIYPLTGKHAAIANDCALCHINGNYSNTPNTCAGCHQDNFDQSVNPDHAALSLPTDCVMCHTPSPDWIPADFPIHDDYYQLNGAHAAIANDCAACHNGDYNNTPNDCFGCHQTDYDNTANPNHNDLQFSTDCAQCHTEMEWIPASFDHDGQYFPIYSGAHEGEWSQCLDCHTNPSNYAEFTCVTCHANPETDDEHIGVNGYVYESTACLACHPTGDATNVFDHNTTNFPLTGEHIGVDCIKCHAGGYAGTPTECVACHQMDFDGTINPNHVSLGLPTDCASCHTTEPDWMPAEFAIHNDYYPLNGAHAAIANDCAACHNGDYNSTPNTCVGCHQMDYDNTTNPNHASAQFSTDCATCHSESEWMPANFDHDAQYFPIYSGAHDGEWSECIDCHTNPSNYAEVSCIVCHANPETDDEHIGVNGYVYENTACLACHPTGDATNIFDHNNTNFPLTGVHITTECIDCHSAGYAGTPTECVACHQADFDGTANPNHVSLGLPTDCAACHTTDPDWAPAAFPDHDSYYQLNGAHAAIANDCAACHNGDYNNTPNTCIGCHQADYDNTTDPDHGVAQFPTDCTQCHTETEWTPSTFDHNNIYPLTGEHAAIANDCALCHINGNYNNTPNICAGCHQADYDQSTNPDHEALAIPTDCAMCHTPSPDWMPADFPIHDDYYQLNGAHAAIANDCAACHNGNYNNTPNTCVGCHQTDYDNTTNPDHQAAQFSTDCASCHSENEWVPANFDHDSQYFPIYSGAHDGEWSECLDCHINPSNYAEFTCVTCHANPETDNEHVGVNGYVYESTACLACHPTGDATNVFDHDNTNFPLTGEHATTTCIECHAGGYPGTPTDCVACHQTDYDGASNPNHMALGLPTDCAACHTTNADWMPADFPDHNSYYQLNGAHAAIANDCAACHNGDYNNTPNTCYGCHQTDYENTTNPDHEAVQFPTDCMDCHGETAWSPANFDHSVFYPLTGAHAIIANDCNLCHINGNYNNTPNTCVGCHQTNYDQSANPNHISLGLPTDCESCHTTDPGWEPATFAIHDNYWVLEGEHLNVGDCAACHNGDYNNTPNTCVGCHQADFDQSNNPNHNALAIPTDCAMCHTIDPNWMPADFPIHDNYYQLNGAHATIANDCVACHNGDYNNTPNTCYGCHQDDYNGTTNPDHLAANFPTTCDDCHSEDGWTPANFDHAIFYPLIGAHATIANDCALCHVGGNYNNTPNTCDGCHTPDYNGSTNPNHNALAIPMDCAMCHTTDPDWMPAAFPIHDNYYQLNGAHAAIANDCATCHNGDYNNTPNTCFGCHQDEYNATTNPAHLSAGFPTTCDDCHSEDGWTPASFDHSIFYPLTGAHAAIANDCALCHIGGNYNNTPNTCDGCHTPDYNGSTNPNHSSLAIPMDCAMCHTTDPDWMPATFPIHDNYYQLNGAHAIIANDCVACHNGDYNNTPNTCFGCHQDDYNNANNPDHNSAGFPTDCLLCHSESEWDPATFDHDNMYFPIYSGKHEDEWNTCVECHIGGNYSSFSCIDCHEHDDPADLADEHQGVSGYSYSSPACYSCHPTGED